MAKMKKMVKKKRMTKMSSMKSKKSQKQKLRRKKRVNNLIRSTKKTLKAPPKWTLKEKSQHSIIQLKKIKEMVLLKSSMATSLDEAQLIINVSIHQMSSPSKCKKAEMKDL